MHRVPRPQSKVTYYTPYSPWGRQAPKEPTWLDTLFAPARTRTYRTLGRVLRAHYRLFYFQTGLRMFLFSFISFQIMSSTYANLNHRSNFETSTSPFDPTDTHMMEHAADKADLLFDRALHGEIFMTPNIVVAMGSEEWDLTSKRGTSG